MHEISFKSLKHFCRSLERQYPRGKQHADKKWAGLKPKLNNCGLERAEQIMWGLCWMAELMDGSDRKISKYCTSAPVQTLMKKGYCLFKTNVYKMLPPSYIDMTIFSISLIFFIDTTLRLGSLWGAKTGLTEGLVHIDVVERQRWVSFLFSSAGKFLFLQRCIAKCEVAGA